METTISITSLEQVPAGLSYVLKELDEIKKIINTPLQPPPPAQEVDHLRTRKETAARLNITLATLHEYTKAGRIAAHRIGNRVLYKERDIHVSLPNKQKMPYA